MKIIWFKAFSTSTLASFFFIFFLFGSIFNFAVQNNQSQSKLEKKIVIDAGHGGIDAGANTEGILEKDINLAIAKNLAAFLDRGSLEIIMTRKEDKLYNDDRNQDIINRTKITNESNADLLVSIHVNSFPSSTSFGGQTFYKPNSEESKELASAIQEKLIEIQPENYRKIKSAPYYILRKSEIPAVIVEVGFISNPQDRERLTNPEEQQKIAQGIGEGIINYFNQKLKETPN
ncbi:N-acetylmuramoyl-L-alanine amidase [Natroniella sulfidigena]|uniref:N-acetylmuramoyl-L-alanine amidase family protein n=1 Tax=Natroniella sulfidigena TaxID=723921 RepID=UPI00200A2322|nr:N-acetylmuramoyl-L-alanine amidase [Natroniella sulfidigena]MCK8816472.1 N-acetylmuramoyl-L-alanine amidase [Natroniella sulfidigena]